MNVGTLPEVQLSDVAIQALALTIGELATNSLKYGALRSAAPIEISADADEDHLTLMWREKADFGAQREGGQGLGLIDRLVTAAKGQISREVSPGLLAVEVTLPIAH